MAKKRNQQPQPKKKENDNLTVSDSLGDDILAKLKEAKKELSNAEQSKEEARQAQIRHERKEREKNKTFEELLNEYGDVGKKY
ncbi:YqkE family protein [Filibacter tadaridae]|uniref:DUF3886 domain-containing protein n=1 Tax=Filibacter tadaridae TaxID=2483811 RepID=A0A3P5XFM6_9BACL|nr:YqkE family protein [Filibacter tadaridae]VDC29658.1 hypothetical protein FILTAD_02214 [Filibacter tadaridae]